MAPGAVQPGKIDGRYEGLTGGEDQRRLYYTVLKLFHITRREWDDMPWHDQRMYIEQLNKDPEYNDDDGDSGGGSAQEITSWDDMPSGA